LKSYCLSCSCRVGEEQEITADEELIEKWRQAVSVFVLFVRDQEKSDKKIGNNPTASQSGRAVGRQSVSLSF